MKQILAGLAVAFAIMFVPSAFAAPAVNIDGGGGGGGHVTGEYCSNAEWHTHGPIWHLPWPGGIGNYIEDGYCSEVTQLHCHYVYITNSCIWHPHVTYVQAWYRYAWWVGINGTKL